MTIKKFEKKNRTDDILSIERCCAVEEKICLERTFFFMKIIGHKPKNKYGEKCAPQTFLTERLYRMKKKKNRIFLFELIYGIALFSKRQTRRFSQNVALETEFIVR